VAYSGKQSTIPNYFKQVIYHSLKSDDVFDSKILPPPSINFNCPHEHQTQSTDGTNARKYQSKVWDGSAKSNPDTSSFMEVNPNPDLRIEVCALFDTHVKNNFTSLIDTGAHLNLISEKKVQLINAEADRSFESTPPLPQTISNCQLEAPTRR
jgi:hypothetical protein